MLTFPTTHKGVGVRAEAIQSTSTAEVIVGGINLITDGTVARMSKIAVASSSYEQRVCDKHYQKNLRRRLRLERVADGRLVIPWWGEDLVCSVIISLCRCCRSLPQSCPHK